MATPKYLCGWWGKYLIGEVEAGGVTFIRVTSLAAGAIY
jgi:hypothetical protein